MRAVTPLRPGDPPQLGPYILLGRIGRGGQGEVYLASGAKGERVAAKLLDAGSWNDERARRLFMREVALAKHVARFCTAQVIDAGMLDSRPYLISEFIDGPSLAEKVAADGPVAGSALERLAIGTATALTAIHQAGIVHRDFKPGNVLIGPDGARVIDFGIAREADATATGTSQIMGTPSFISPEQIGGTPAAAPSDVFAWGVTIAYAATGEAPFGQDSIPAVINRVLNEEPDLSRIPEPLRGLVGSCLAKDPAARPTAQALLLALLGGKTDELPVPVVRSTARSFALSRTLLVAALALLVGGGAGAAAVRVPVAAQASAATPPTATTGATTGAVTGAVTGAGATKGPIATPSASGTPTAAPDVAGLPRQEAVAKIRQAGLAVGKVTVDCSASGTTGNVLRAALRQGAVDLVVRTASARVPDARGWPLGQGKAALEKAGFTVNVGYRQGRDWVGKVAALRPAAGSPACTGSVVQLWIGVR